MKTAILFALASSLLLGSLSSSANGQKSRLSTKETENVESATQDLGPNAEFIAWAENAAREIALRDYQTKLRLIMEESSDELTAQASNQAEATYVLRNVLTKRELELIRNYSAPDENRISNKVKDLAMLSFEAVKELLIAWPGYYRFDREFNVIPKGFLPGERAEDPLIPIASFQANQPITRELWKYFMGEMPSHIQSKTQRKNWENCRECPVTYVNWMENDGKFAEIHTFLRRLNRITKALGCIYDLPTDSQLHYLHRADPTGENKDPYSAGVTQGNMDQYVMHWGPNIVPVGSQTEPNRFGFHIGYVWRITKDFLDSHHPGAGLRIRGGSWDSYLQEVYQSKRASSIKLGKRVSNVGFSLVRVCNGPLPVQTGTP